MKKIKNFLKTVEADNPIFWAVYVVAIFYGSIHWNFYL